MPQTLRSGIPNIQPYEKDKPVVMPDESVPQE